MAPSHTVKRPELLVGRDVVERINKSLAEFWPKHPLNAMDLYEISKLGLEYRRQVIDRYVKSCFGLVVQSGPFRGTRYLPESAGSFISPKILGTYEIELSDLFSDLSAYKFFVDIGCAEGYFAVGALVANTDMRTIAFDLDPRARRLCQALAIENDVAERIEIRETCNPWDLDQLANPETLFMVDIEGSEVELFSGITPSSISACDFIIETHYTPKGSTLNFMLEVFSRSHDVTVIEQSARDPSMFPELMALGQVDRFIAQWEGRGPEPWVFARAKR